MTKIVAWGDFAIRPLDNQCSKAAAQSLKLNVLLKKGQNKDIKIPKHDFFEDITIFYPEDARYREYPCRRKQLYLCKIPL